MADISPTSVSCPAEQHTSKGGYVKLTVTKITQDIVTNKTTVDYKITIEGTPWVNLYGLDVVLGGKILYSNVNTLIKTSWIAGDIIKSGTETYENNSDGSLTLSVWIKQLFYYTWSQSRWDSSSFVQTKSDSMVCSTIPRVGELDHWSCSSEYLDGVFTYAITPKSDSLYNRLRISIPNVVVLDYVNVGQKPASQFWANYSIPQNVLTSIYNRYPNTSTCTIGLILETYSDSNYSNKIGESSELKIEDMKFPTSLSPSVSLGISLDNTSIPLSVRSTFDGMYIQGKSKVNVSITASGKNGTTIARYETLINGRAYKTSSFTSKFLTSFGNTSIKSTVTDSRAYTNSDEKIISVHEYLKPQVIPISGTSEVLCYRSDNSGNPTNNSDKIWIKAKKSYYSLDNKNSCTLRWRSKLSSEEWGNQTWNTLQTTDDEYNALLDVTFLTTNSYTIQIGVVDTIGEFYSIDFNIPTESIPFHLGAGGKSVGIGRYADTSNENSLSVGWNTYLSGEVYFSGEKLDDYVVEQGYSGVWVYQKWESGIVKLWATTTGSAGPFTVAVGGVYYSNNKIKLQLPFDLITDSNNKPIVYYTNAQIQTTGIVTIGNEPWVGQSYVKTESGVQNVNIGTINGQDYTTGINVNVMVYVVGKWK